MKFLDVSICHDIAKVITNDNAQFAFLDNKVLVFDEYCGQSFVTHFEGGGIMRIYKVSDPTNFLSGRSALYDINWNHCCGDPSSGYTRKLRDLLGKD